MRTIEQLNYDWTLNAKQLNTKFGYWACRSMNAHFDRLSGRTL